MREQETNDMFNNLGMGRLSCYSSDGSCHRERSDVYKAKGSKARMWDKLLKRVTPEIRTVRRLQRGSKLMEEENRKRIHSQRISETLANTAGCKLAVFSSAFRYMQASYNNIILRLCSITNMM